MHYYLNHFSTEVFFSVALYLVFVRLNVSGDAFCWQVDNLLFCVSSLITWCYSNTSFSEKLKDAISFNLSFWAIIEQVKNMIFMRVQYIINWHLLYLRSMQSAVSYSIHGHRSIPEDTEIWNIFSKSLI